MAGGDGERGGTPRLAPGMGCLNPTGPSHSFPGGLLTVASTGNREQGDGAGWGPGGQLRDCPAPPSPRPGQVPTPMSAGRWCLALHPFNLRAGDARCGPGESQEGKLGRPRATKASAGRGQGQGPFPTSAEAKDAGAAGGVASRRALGVHTCSS